MNPQDFDKSLSFLQSVTLTDPFMSLCRAVAWLDPLALQDDVLIEDAYYGHDDPWADVTVAWEMTRTCFPQLYAETTVALRTQPNVQQLSSRLCDGISDSLSGGSLYDLTQIHFGLPFFSQAIDITDAIFFADRQYAPLLAVYKLLGVELDPSQTYSIPDEMSEAAWVAEVLAFSLRQETDSTYDKIACLLDWMFAQSGNSVVDLTEEEMYEMGVEPLAWTPEDLQFNAMMHDEATEIVLDALQGLDALIANPILQSLLSNHAQCIAKRIHSIKKENRYDYRNRDAARLSRGIEWLDITQPTDEPSARDDAQTV